MLLCWQTTPCHTKARAAAARLYSGSMDIAASCVRFFFFFFFRLILILVSILILVLIITGYFDAGL